MRIVATVLSGNSESLIGDAIASVIDWVDAILLIDTGITDGTLGVAKTAAGGKLQVEKFAWCNDFSAARNFALQRAAAAGASWAWSLDTDERFSFPGVRSVEELRAALQATPEVLVWLVFDRDGSYCHQSFIRVPTQLVWQGRVHEALVGARAGQRRVLGGIHFWELPKTHERCLAKLQRDLEVLAAETRQKPDNARWWYYLGQTWEELGEPGQAVEAYRHCYELDKWAEQAAWACFRAATCFFKLGEFGQALEICSLGLTKQAESPELAWLAGLCCLKLGRPRDAVAWEQIAGAMGHFEGLRMGQQRISFRYLPGWYEGPYDVLRFAWQQLHQPGRAEECEKKWLAAQSSRAQHATQLSLTPPGLTSANVQESLISDGSTVPAGAIGRTKLALPTVCGPSGVTTRVAVLGLYSSGSTAVAEVLHHLDVCMGRSFWANYFEPRWLADQLRSWWCEPDFCEAIGKEERVRRLARWVRDIEMYRPGPVGAKHPLLCLCGADLLDAWGPDTKFIWSYRPLEDSISSLQRRGWWPGKERTVQERLWASVTAFLSERPHLKVDFRDIVTRPEQEVERIVEYLGVELNEDRVDAAVRCIRPRAPEPGGQRVK